MSTLHITSGEYFNATLKTKYGKIGVPFNEAMMTGNAHEELFSSDFVSLRAKTHGVSETLYQEKLEPFLNALQKPDWDEIVLWFGKDVFCQMNMLTVLAYLEKQKYHGTVYVQYIDDETSEKIGDKQLVNIDGKGELYQKVLVEKIFAKTDDSALQNAINLYLDYLSKDGFLIKTVKENAFLPKEDLVKKLLLCSKDYGLSDLQALQLIEEYAK